MSHFQYLELIFFAGQDVDEPRNCFQVAGCDIRYLVPPSLKQSYLNLTCVECDDIPQMSRVSVFWQIPQFALIGVSEILASITALEFFYSQAPTCMRSVSQALNISTAAVGTWLTIPLILIVNSGGFFGKKWIEENIDDGQLEKFFFLLAGLMGLNQVSASGVVNIHASICIIQYISGPHKSAIELIFTVIVCVQILFYFVSRGYQYKTQQELAIGFEDKDRTAPM